MNPRHLIVAALVVVTGCADSHVDGEPSDRWSSLTGYLLLRSGQPAELCEALVGSPPSSCEGDPTIVTGLDPSEINELESADQVRWTTHQITLHGDVDNGQLRVPATPTGSAITGRAQAGPTCPVEVDPPDSTCAPRSVADASIVIRDADDDLTATLVTDSTGRFAVEVSPGTYVVEPASVEGFLEQAGPLTVIVEDEPVAVQIDYDTGIR